MNCFKKTT